MLPRRTLATALALGAIAVPAHAAPLEIVMENLVIAPAHATAKVGDNVEMDQQDIFAHTATAGNGDFDVTMPPRKSVTLVLQKAATINYYCRYHPNLKATLVVEP